MTKEEVERTARRLLYVKIASIWSTTCVPTQNHRLAVSLGCEFQYAKKLGYASSYNLADERMFSQIGINCHLCPRQACSQRAHQPVFMELPLDTTRRGNTRYES